MAGESQVKRVKWKESRKMPLKGWTYHSTCISFVVYIRISVVRVRSSIVCRSGLYGTVGGPWRVHSTYFICARR